MLYPSLSLLHYTTDRPCFSGRFIVFASGKSYNALVMKNMPKALRFLLRMDVMDRILVFLSLCFFLVAPSAILYSIKDLNNSTETVLPGILMIAVICGTGAFTIYRPYRTSWFFFLECLIVLSLYPDEFRMPKDVSLPLNLKLIYALELVLCIFGLIINFFYLLHYFNLKRRLKSELNEGTNHDDFYHVLSGYEPESSKKIQSELDQITKDNPQYRQLMDMLRRLKLSKYVRAFSLAVVYIIFVVQLIRLANRGNIYQFESFYPILIGMLTLPLTFIASVVYPRDFKYQYYFNGILFCLGGFIGNVGNTLSPLGFVLSIIVLGLSLLITLIAEGRTWTGSKPD